MKYIKQVGFGWLILLCATLGCGQSERPEPSQMPELFQSGYVPSGTSSPPNCDSIAPEADTIIRGSFLKAVDVAVEEYYSQIISDSGSSGVKNYNCREGGSVQFQTLRIRREEISTDHSRGEEMEGKVQIILNNCQEGISRPTFNPPEYDLCYYSVPITGKVVCDWSGSHTIPTGECFAVVCGTADSRFNCTTAETCDGITIQNEEGEHTGGLSLERERWLDDVIYPQPTEGILCVDGMELDAENIYENEVFLHY